MIEVIKSEDFENKVLSSNKLVLVDFFGTWCMPCRMLSSILDSVADANPDVDFFKVDIDENADLTKTYSIMTVPTMILFRNGTELEKVVGFRQQKQIIDLIEQYK